jgi:hypothetical protein
MPLLQKPKTNPRILQKGDVILNGGEAAVRDLTTAMEGDGVDGDGLVQAA